MMKSRLMALAALVSLAPCAAAAAGFDCLIEPWQVVEIRAPVDGVIARVRVQRGDAIKRGQVLVELSTAAEQVAVESARYRAQMDGQIVQSRSRFEYATKKLARAVDLQSQNFVSAQARDEADTERRLAEAELQVAIENRELAKIEYRRAIEQLAMRTMTAPFSGVVVDRMLNPGDLAESGAGRKAVLKVAQIDPLRVDIVVPAALFGRLVPGMRARVVPQGMSITLAATIKLVDRVIDAASGTFVARLELPNPTGKLPGGMRCQANFDGIKPLAGAAHALGAP